MAALVRLCFLLPFALLIRSMQWLAKPSGQPLTSDSEGRDVEKNAVRIPKYEQWYGYADVH